MLKKTLSRETEMTDEDVLTPSPTEGEYQKVKPKSKRFTSLVLCIGIVIVVVGYLYVRKLWIFQKSTAQQTQEEAKALVVTVGKLVVLPEGEVPTIATVVDPAQLQSQPFFVNAKKGDKVLIYIAARRAVLYDPQLNKIVEVAPINISNPSGASSATP